MRRPNFNRLNRQYRPLLVVQADLRDYSPSLSHELILALLRQFGVPQRWRTFFHRFLGPHIRYRGETPEDSAPPTTASADEISF